VCNLFLEHDDDHDDNNDNDDDYFRYDLVRLRRANLELLLKIRQREARKTNFLNYYHEFKGILISHSGIPGYHFFGTKKDIMNPLNGIYNKETDSILLEAKIKVLS
jgi:hypothetical protein